MGQTRTNLIIAGLVALGIGLLWFANNSGEIQPATVTETDSSSADSTPVKEPASSTAKLAQKYLGSEACVECHELQYKDWQDSHHDRAMQVASAETVLADFNDSHFNAKGIESLFYQKDGDFFIRTPGSSGETEDFQVSHTFGVEPLQQYIVSFPNGRKQVFPVAWDTRKNEWFFVQAALQPKPGEWIHWTQGGMNWNGMCADCHSTNLKKNYKLKKDSYSTTFSDVDVACEACHGPGARHVAKVTDPQYRKGEDDPEIDMRPSEKPAVVVDKCGRCHARRHSLTEKYKHNSDSLLDHYLPAVLRSDLYHADGQVLEEVFVYGSYLQSRKYQYGVTCTNCHNPHSGELRAEGNEVCSSCHAADSYDNDGHHHHTDFSAGSADKTEETIQCVDCHMPGKFYMVRDERRDHSFRVPRPDLSASYATPNACENCHADKDAEWASKAIERWYGKKRRPHFSDLLVSTSAATGIDPEALLALLVDQQQPNIVRATAAFQLAPLLQIPRVSSAMINALSDPSALLRTYAAQGLAALPQQEKTRLLSPLLDDPVRSVRIAAAAGLLDVAADDVNKAMHSDFISARAEYQASINSNVDLPLGRHQLAVDYHRQGQIPQAERSYLESLSIDDHLNSARLNLAQLYYQQGRLEEVESLYRKVIEQEPGVEQAHYSLGLLMAEKGDLEQAGISLLRAAEIGNNPRAWYNLAVLHHQQAEIDKAEAYYLKALAFSPLEADFLLGIYSLYSQLEKWDKLERIIDDSLMLSPNNRQVLEMKMSMLKQRKTQSLR